MLGDPGFMKEILLAGGPRDNKYCEALEIFRDIELKQNINKKIVKRHRVLRRMALAIALELCVPIPLFDEPDDEVYAMKRYQQYEQAYLNGDLDPAFSSFSVWEL